VEDLPWIVSFTRVVQAGSFTAAAERLDVASSVVSKHVAKLEHALGARLLQRSTRKLSLTEAGTAYYEHCARIVEELEQAREAITHLQAAPRGRLRVSALLSFTSAHIIPALPEFFERYPEIELEIVNNDRLVDLADEGYDLALRLTPEPGQQLVAKRLAPIRWMVCATPQYLERNGVPGVPQDLLRHRCLGYPHELVAGEWRFTRGKELIPVAVPGPLKINNIEALHRLALENLGIALLPTYIASDSLKRGRLVPVLDDYALFPDLGVYAVYLPQRYATPKLRVFLDFLTARFGGDLPYWDRGLPLKAIGT
jgi:DNA-binding transcriptional LysR family regulator